MPLDHTRRSLFDQLPLSAGALSLEPFDRRPDALARYRRAIERSDLAIAIASVDPRDVGTILEINSAFAQLMATSREQLIGTNWAAFLAPEDVDAWTAALAETLALGTGVDRIEYRWLRPDGSRVWASASVVPVRGADRTSAAALVQMVDISARKAYETEWSTLDEHTSLRGRLVEAIERDVLQLMYEPIFDLENGGIVAVDAVGPIDPEQPDLRISQLLSIAEDLDLGLPLGRWLLGRACRDRAAWASRGPNGDTPHVVIHASEQMLAIPEVVDECRRIIGEAGASITQIAIEIDERTLTDAAVSVERGLAELSAAGARVYVGRFGRGISSLARLRSVPVDGLTVASEFIAALSNPDDLRFVSALVSMGRAAEIDIVAEGVEDTEHLRILQDLGCPLGKGTLLGAATHSEGIHELLAQPARPMRTQRQPLAPPEIGPHLGPTLPLGVAADALRVSPSTLRRWADDGRIRSIRTSGGHRRFPASEVRRVSGSDRPRAELRLEPAIREPKPELATLLSQHGAGLVERAPRSMYAGTPGWFATVEAHPDLVDWVEAVAEAARAGDQTLLSAACAKLCEQAAASGALLIETLAFVSVFFQAIEHVIGLSKGAPETSLDARRVAAAARQTMLLHVDDLRLKPV